MLVTSGGRAACRRLRPRRFTRRSLPTLKGVGASSDQGLVETFPTPTLGAPDTLGTLGALGTAGTLGVGTLGALGTAGMLGEGMLGALGTVGAPGTLGTGGAAGALVVPGA